MIDYETYKNKVYDIFIKRCLTDVSLEEKIKYLNSNEMFIKKSYNGDVYSYQNLDMKKVFNDTNLYSRICSNLEELY